MQFILLFFLSSLLYPLSLAAVQQAWVTRYSNGSNTTNQPIAIALDKDGNVYVAGHSSRTNAPYDYDYIVLKYNSLGVQQWINRFGSPGIDDKPRKMVVSTNGDVFVTGTTETVKYLTSGLLAWSAPYAGRDLAIDADGNSYVTGFRSDDFSTVKLNPSGSNVWLRTWDYRGKADSSRVIAIDQAANLFVGGFATFFCQGRCYQEVWLLKYDSSGALLWNILHVQGSYTEERCEYKGFACDVEGSVYIADELFTTGGPEPWGTAKIRSNGTYSWSTRLNRVSYPGVSATVLDHNANVYYTGGLGESGAFLSFKLTADGTNLWEAQYTGPAAGFHRGAAIAADSAGNAYVTGPSTGVGTSTDYATIKYGTNGQQLWLQRFTEPGNSDDQAAAIAVNQNGDVYVTGFSNPSPGTYQITTIKYVQTSPIEKKSNGDILLSFCGNPGSNYVIEASSTLTNWSAIATTTAERHWPLHLRRHQRPFAPTTLLPHQTGMTPLSRRAMRKASESLIHFAPRKS